MSPWGGPKGWVLRPKATPTSDPNLGPAGISCGDMTGPLRLENCLQSRRDSAERFQLSLPSYAHPCFLPKRHFGRPQGTEGESRPRSHPAMTLPLGAAPWPEPKAMCVSFHRLPPGRWEQLVAEGFPTRTPPRGFAGTFLTLRDPYPPPPFLAPGCALAPSAPR